MKMRRKVFGTVLVLITVVVSSYYWGYKVGSVDGHLLTFFIPASSQIHVLTFCEDTKKPLECHKEYEESLIKLFLRVHIDTREDLSPLAEYSMPYWYNKYAQNIDRVLDYVVEHDLTFECKHHQKTDLPLKEMETCEEYNNKVNKLVAEYSNKKLVVDSKNEQHN